MSVILVFITIFVYLHQKIVISVENYRISKNIDEHKRLVDLRDKELRDFFSLVSCDKINEWARENKFVLAKKNSKIVLVKEASGHRKKDNNLINKGIDLVKSILNISSSEARAQTK